MVFYVHCFFPTCQVRIVRFYQSCSPPPPPPPPPPSPPTRRLLLAVQIPVGTAGPPPRAPDPSWHYRTPTARSQWALPDLNRDFQVAVGTTGPQPRAPDPSGKGTAGPPPRAPDPSGHCRTPTASCRSTATSRSQWALPDLNRELQIPVGTAGPQPRAPDPSGHCRTSTAR